MSNMFTSVVRGMADISLSKEENKSKCVQGGQWQRHCKTEAWSVTTGDGISTGLRGTPERYRVMVPEGSIGAGNAKFFQFPVRT